MPASNSVKYIFEAVDNMSRNLGEMKSRLKEFENGIGSAQKRSEGFRQSMIATGDKLKNFGNQMKWVSVGLTAAGTASLYAFAKMEKGIKDAQNVMGVEKIGQWTGELKKAQTSAVAMGFSIDEVNSGLFKTLKEMGANEVAFKTFTNAQKLAIAGNATLDDTLLAMTGTMDIYGNEIKDTAVLADMFFRAQQNGDLTIQEMAQSFKGFAVYAKNAGISAEQAIPMFSILADKMKDAGSVTMLLRMASDSVMTPSKQQKLIFDKLGITYGITKVKQVGMLKVLEQITSAYKNNTNTLALAIPQIKTLSALNNVSAEDFDKVRNSVADGTAFLDAYKNSAKSLTQQLKETKGEVFNLGDAIGKDIAKPAGPILEAFKSISKAFREDLDPTIRQLIIYFGAVVAAASPVAVALGWILKVLGGATLLASAKVILIIAGAITALAYAIIRVNEAINNFPSAAWKSIRDMAYVLKYIPGMGGLGNLLAPMAQKEVEWQKFLSKPSYLTAPELPGYSSVKSTLDFNMTINAPKGVVQSYSTEAIGTGLNLGVNMGSR